MRQCRESHFTEDVSAEGTVNAAENCPWLRVSFPVKSVLSESANNCSALLLNDCQALQKDCSNTR